MAMAYRLATSLATLRDNINSIAPNRKRASDGWIGDPAHRARKSDHNPNANGVVTALDVTHDPVTGVDGQKLANAVILDERVKYVIWNSKIWSVQTRKWSKYSGKNPHDKHVHVSVKGDAKNADDGRPWATGIREAAEAAAELPPAPAVHEHQTVKLGSQGGCVFELQKMLDKDLKVDGDFGPKTEKAVKAFQKANGLVADGIVGPYTWAALEKKAKKAVPAEAPAQLLTVPPDIAPPADKGTPGYAVDKLKSLGWERGDAIAWVSNMLWESGGHRINRLNWTAHGDRGNSKGAGQWNKAAGRWAALDRFAAKRGTDWTDPDTQLEFLNHELKTTERGAAKAVRGARTLSEKVATAAKKYWRPGVPHTDRRIKIAQKLDKEIPA